MSEAKQSPSRIFFEEKDEALTQLIPKFAIANLSNQNQTDLIK